MKPISTGDLLDALNWRYATKVFDSSRKIPAETWDALEQALVLSPSSFGLQPWKFVVVQDAKIRKQLAEASWGQTQPVDCSHYVVFLGRKNLGADQVDRLLERTAKVRGVAKESLSGYRDVILGSVAKAREGAYLDVWQSRQSYIALGQFMAAAAVLGIDACPMEGLDPAKYDSILGVDTKNWGTLCACAAGYRSAQDKYASLAKVRYDRSEIIQER